MQSLAQEFITLSNKYERLKQDYRERGIKNNELNSENQKLESENHDLKALFCEERDVKLDVLQANIKIYRLERQIKDKNAIIAALKEKLRRN